MKTVVAAALGECVHVAGITKFLRLAQKAGWRTIFLGPAVSIDRVIQVAKDEKADLVGVSYRLTPENGERLLGEFAEAADELRQRGTRFAFGGTPPLVERARALGFFEATFNGTETSDQVLSYLKGGYEKRENDVVFPQDVIKRIKWKSPYPIIRHHFGLPSVDETASGIEKISEAKVLDVISLGTDQDAQENFFHPERQNPRRRGAGGVPVRSADDFRILYQATRRGNFPLMRTYTGTDDFIKLAEIYVETINIAWAAIPLFWFNRMDGRGPWELEDSIRIHQELIQWYSRRGIPVELNEPHHWGMRDAPDSIFAATAYLSAYNAKALGVKDYIAQLMFNSPPGLTDVMDLAKMIAVLKMIEPLQSHDFNVWKQTRTGLLSYPVDLDFARAHLASSIYLQMALKPHIIHVVGFTEADHISTADEVIESVKLAHRSIENGLGQPDMSKDPLIQERVEEIIRDVTCTLNAIRSIGSVNNVDPLTDASTLAKAIEMGILDAPHLKNNPYARGEIETRIDHRGACRGINPKTGEFEEESKRLRQLL
ncbi:MAG TPA: methionine synthase [Anaerolineae bacterium]|nr:methionine synthase [Anaerolineae bacterium]